MGDIRGPITTLNHVLPQGLDANRLAQWRLRNGRTYAEFRSDVANSLDGVNSELLQRWGDLIYITEDDYLEYPNGGSVIPAQETSDLDVVDAVKGESVGHMIDLRVLQMRVASTTRELRDMREAVLTATIRNRIQAWRDYFERKILTRALTDTEVLLGTAGYNVGFASGSGTVQFAPMAYGGVTFATSHDHYIGKDSDASANDFGDLLDALATTLAEHGHEQPFIAYVSELNVAAYRALENYIRPVRDTVVIDRGGGTSGTSFFRTGMVASTPPSGGRYFGDYDTPFGTVELRAVNRLPTGYATMFKSYGMNDPRNPIYVRVHPQVGFGLRLLDEPNFDMQYPIKSIMMEAEMGVSAGRDRVGGASGLLVSGGAWANATVT